jgi:hypothetical protein
MVKSKQSFSPCQKLSKNMWRSTCTHVIQGDCWLLMVESQIDTLIFGPSFGHNLCYKYSNGSCKPISNIYISKKFHWYKKFFNPMSFNLWNLSLNIQNSIGIIIPKLGVHLGMCGFIPSHSLTFPGVWMWLSGYIIRLHLAMFLPWLWA